MPNTDPTSQLDQATDTPVLQVPVVQQPAKIDPTPLLQLVDHPNGHSMLAVVQEAENKWRVVDVPGRETRCREHLFADLKSFVRFVARHATPRIADIGIHSAAGCLVVDAVFDPRDPHADRAAARLAPHPKLQPWLDAFARKEPLSIFELHELVRESLEMIDQGVGEVILTKLARMTTADKDTIDVKIAENGLVELAGVSRQTDVNEKLPARFVLYAEPYLGAAGFVHEARIEVFLAASKGPAGLLFKPKARLELVYFEATMKAVRQLREALPDFEVGAANLRYERVPLVPRLYDTDRDQKVASVAYSYPTLDEE